LIFICFSPLKQHWNFQPALKKELHNCFFFFFALRVAAFASPGVNA